MINLKFVFKYSKLMFAVLFCSLILSLAFSFEMVVNAPEDYLQGVSAKIMYIHIPAAQISLMIYILIGISSALFLIYRNPFYDIFSNSLVIIGLIYTFVTLITGSIWGKPTWGTWWVWDARLTSMLILSMIYFGYISLRGNTCDEKGARIAAIFGVCGLVNIPIIKFSVYLWNTLHQQSSIFKLTGPSIHESMLYPLISSTISFIIFTLLILLLTVNTELLKRKLYILKNLK